MNNVEDLNFILGEFVGRLAQVTHVVAVSADGLLVARSPGLPKDKADQVAAVCAGQVSLLRSASKLFEAGVMESAMVVFEGGWMITVAVSDGASLLALATKRCDIGQVSHELATLIGRVGPALTPAARTLQPPEDLRAVAQPYPAGR